MAKKLGENKHYLDKIDCECETADMLFIELLHVYTSGLSQLADLIVKHSNKKIMLAASFSVRGKKLMGYRQESSFIEALLAPCVKLTL